MWGKIHGWDLSTLLGPGSAPMSSFFYLTKIRYYNNMSRKELKSLNGKLAKGIYSEEEVRSIELIKIKL